MFSTTDTIVAIATPQGRGALGVVRLSGPDAHRIAQVLLRRTQPLEPRRATFASARFSDVPDQVIATWFQQPASFTGEDVVEISAHGSSVVLAAIVRGALTNGARAAAPGEFTLRAYLNGKLDLPRAEAVADLVDAVTPAQARAAFDQLNGTLTAAIADIDAELFDLVAKLEASVDFPEEGYHFLDPGDAARAIAGVISRIDALLSTAARGRLVRDGATVVLAGKPNAGKSSLFNRLLGADRAIVTAIPGTTRDFVSEVVDLGGLRVTLVDTAGLTDSADPVEREGVGRATRAAASADLVLLVLDGSLSEDSDVCATQVVDSKRLTVLNKCDVARPTGLGDGVRVSALTGAGIDDLIREIHQKLGLGVAADTPAVTNVRHIDLLQRASASLLEAHSSIVAAGDTLPEEFVLVDLQDARRLLEEISGVRTPDDVLIHVFSRFCIGK